jgi:hypothetical protein
MIRTTLLAATVLAAALPASHASAAPRYKSINFKFADEAGMTDINKKGDMTGGYWKGALGSTTVRKCFVLTGTTGMKTPLSNAAGQKNSTECWGLNDSGTVVGDYINTAGVKTGFVYSGGTFTDVAPPGALATEAWAISNKGVIGGLYFDASSVQHGFLFDGTTYTTVDVTGDTAAGVYGVNSAGQYVVEATNAKDVVVSLLYTGTSSVAISFPASTGNDAHHINDAGLVACTFDDKSNVAHAGVYDSVAKAYYVVDYPGAADTIGDGVNVKMKVVGRYETSAKPSLGYAAVGVVTP